jgi:hypothetical protein
LLLAIIGASESSLINSATPPSVGGDGIHGSVAWCRHGCEFGKMKLPTVDVSTSDVILRWALKKHRFGEEGKPERVYLTT